MAKYDRLRYDYMNMLLHTLFKTPTATHRRTHSIRISFMQQDMMWLMHLKSFAKEILLKIKRKIDFFFPQPSFLGLFNENGGKKKVLSIIVSVIPI